MTLVDLELVVRLIAELVIILSGVWIGIARRMP